MKALVIRQPWASQIISGKKKIEYRSWQTKYRGEILIVSEKKAIGIMNISNIKYNPETKMFEWIISDVRKIKPFPVRGKLGLFEVPVHQHNDCLEGSEHR